MDEFETINLNSRACKICKQETGEELISCILHNQFSTTEKSIIFSTDDSVSSIEEGEPSFAHRVCLERWDTVMKNTYFPQPKKTWKDRLKGFITTGSANNNVTETWTPVDYNVGPASDRPIFESATKPEKARSSYSVFSGSKEAYRVENVGERDTERDHWRRNKIRICSVDSEDEVEERVLSSKGRVFRRTRTECEYIIFLCVPTPVKRREISNFHPIWSDSLS